MEDWKKEPRREAEAKPIMELAEMFFIYCDRQPLHYEIKDTSRSEADFRQTVIADWGEEKRVIKIACNAFTTAHRINGWRLPKNMGRFLKK